MKKFLPIILFFMFIQFSYADYQDDLGFNKSNLGTPVKSAQDIKQQNYSSINSSNYNKVEKKKIITRENTFSKKNTAFNEKTTLTTANKNNKISKKPSKPQKNKTNKPLKKPSYKIISNTTKKGIIASPKTNTNNKKNIINSNNMASIAPNNNQKSALPTTTPNIKQNNPTSNSLGENKSITTVLPTYKESTSPVAPLAPTMNEAPNIPNSSIPDTNTSTDQPTLQDRHLQQDQVPSTENLSPDDETLENNLQRSQNNLNSTLNPDNSTSSDTGDSLENGQDGLPGENQDDDTTLSNTFID